MAIDTVLDDLKSIKGYRAAGIMTHTGEMLAAHSLDTKINFNVVGATFNDIFRSAHEAAGKVGMGANNETQIVTPSGIIIMVCTGVSSAAHVHMIAIIDKAWKSGLGAHDYGKDVIESSGGTLLVYCFTLNRPSSGSPAGSPLQAP